MRTLFFNSAPSPTVREGPRDFGLPKSSGGCCLCQRHRQRAKATRFTYYMYFFNVQNKSLLFFKFVNKKEYKKKRAKNFLLFLKLFLFNFALLFFYFVVHFYPYELLPIPFSVRIMTFNTVKWIVRIVASVFFIRVFFNATSTIALN